MHTTGCICDSAVLFPLKEVDQQIVIYTKGCVPQFEKWLQDNLTIVAGIFIGIALLQVRQPVEESTGPVPVRALQDRSFCNSLEWPCFKICCEARNDLKNLVCALLKVWLNPEILQKNIFLFKVGS